MDRSDQPAVGLFVTADFVFFCGQNFSEGKVQKTLFSKIPVYMWTGAELTLETLNDDPADLSQEEPPGGGRDRMAHQHSQTYSM